MVKSKKYSLSFLTIVSIIILIASCKHELDYPVENNNPIVVNPPDTLETDPCHPDSIYFENDILPLIISTCAQPGCHDAATAQNGVILIDYSSIMNHGDVEPFDPESSDIYEVITDPDQEDRMPPQGEGSLTQDQINDIYLWIAQGAQNNGCSECDTTDVTFSGAVLPIIELNCQGCHSGSSPNADLTLLDYTDVSAVAINGSLYPSITGTGGYEQMPFNGNPLSQCDIDKIEIWINDGAPDN